MELLTERFCDALLRSIEAMPIADGLTLDQLRETLMDLARQPGVDSMDRFSLKVINRARQRFVACIQGLSTEDLRHVAPLPFRRVLGDDESKAIWARLYDVWGVGAPFWYPLSVSGRDLPGPIVAFWEGDFLDGYGDSRLHRILAARGITRIWELQDVPSNHRFAEYEMDLGLMQHRRGMWEVYWTSDAMDWVVYTSHEQTIAFAGDWLVPAILDSWPGWQELWHSPDWETGAPQGS